MGSEPANKRPEDHMNINDRVINALQRRTAAYQQSENAAYIYTVNYAATLQTATISTSTWSSAANGVTISVTSNTDTTATAKLSGTPGRYKVVNKITTSTGETDERIISLHIMANDQMSQGDYE